MNCQNINTSNPRVRIINKGIYANTEGVYLRNWLEWCIKTPANYIYFLYRIKKRINSKPNNSNKTAATIFQAKTENNLIGITNISIPNAIRSMADNMNTT